MSDRNWKESGDILFAIAMTLESDVEKLQSALVDAERLDLMVTVPNVIPYHLVEPVLAHKLRAIAVILGAELSDQVLERAHEVLRQYRAVVSEQSKTRILESVSR